MKKSVISFLFISVSGMLLMGCMKAGSGGSAPVYFMPPDMAAEHSTAETKFWSGDVTMEEGVRQEGLWEIRYEPEVPEVQLHGFLYDFGRPERIFVDGMPSTLEPWKEEL
ncbi:MAG: hypothetical protein SVR04_16685 [Spirochaetota bacterium]|nr:hypothetical protein [Spirochaetota bacterium]